MNNVRKRVPIGEMLGIFGTERHSMPQLNKSAFAYPNMAERIEG